uniref:Programmed cell death protein 4 n=1 Tax=Cacopsylla melanoneura TaxID=428564 RepID=A0A8D8SYQ2_9HEMI
MEQEFEVEGTSVEEKLANGNAAGSSDHFKSAGDIAIDQRVKKKAKRLIKQGSKEGVTNGTNVVNVARSWKNTRRPRNGHARGLPKKGGAGGKGVWGKPGSEIAEESIDKNDPNYDSDSMENDDIVLEPIIHEPSDEEIKKSIESIVLEYYEHGDSEEAALSLEELNILTKKHLITQIAIELALDHKPSHREMTSVLISDLYGRLIKQKDIAAGFDVLLKNLSDLKLDTPDADTILGNFLARAIADDCVPPKLITTFKSSIENEPAQATLSRADMLLSMKNGMHRLDNVWGLGGGLRPVKSLVRQMHLLLQEYLSSSDTVEATRCLQDLEVPHVHHELVYEVRIGLVSRAQDVYKNWKYHISTTSLSMRL